MYESFLDGKVTLWPGDCLDVMPGLDSNSHDACVTDPPYGLGFMGKSWDHGVPGVPYWKLVFHALKPGAYLLAFGGTRTFGRMQVAIEDAGFEIRDTIMWLYGSGFPKSLDVSKAIDKAAGAEREIVGEYEVSRDWSRSRSESGDGAFADRSGGGHTASRATTVSITAPATDAARGWQGFGTALKPACEPIVLARKPLSESTVAANVLKWGTGALNIDGARVATDEVISNHGETGQSEPTSFSLGARVAMQTAGQALGRWPRARMKARAAPRRSWKPSGPTWQPARAVMLNQIFFRLLFAHQWTW